MENEKGNNGVAAAVVVALVVIAGIAGWIMYSKSSNQPLSPTPNQKGTSPESSQSPVKKSYKDGNYEAVGSYISPGGDEQIDVSLTLKDGVINDINVTPLATRPTSKEKQAEFVSGYKTMVVGKSIDDVSLTVVSGSSLTSTGFNDAISKIKAQAAQ